jgi:hypothetical protein
MPAFNPALILPLRARIVPLAELLKTIGRAP